MLGEILAKDLMHWGYSKDKYQCMLNWLTKMMYTDKLLVDEKYLLGNMFSQIFKTLLGYLMLSTKPWYRG